MVRGEAETQKYAASACGAAGAEQSNFEHFTLAFSNYTKAERKQRAKQEQQKTREHGIHTQMQKHKRGDRMREIERASRRSNVELSEGSCIRQYSGVSYHLNVNNFKIFTSIILKLHCLI